MNPAVQAKLDSLNSNISKLETYRSVLQNDLQAVETEERCLRYKAELHQKCTEVFKTWLEDSLEKNINSMADLATTALHHIITDQVLTFKIHQDPKLNRLQMRFALEQDGIEGDPLESFGGGTAVIISLVLRLAVMSRMNMANLLLLDESLPAIAQKYVPSAAEFIRQLAEETGINIFMVTHNPDYLSHAHVAYEGTKEDGKLKLRRLKTG